MVVLYDSQIFDLQKYGGISRYFSEIIPALKSMGVDPLLPLRISNNEYTGQFAENNPMKIFPGISLPGFNRLKWETSRFVNQKASKKIFSESNFDIFHPTYYNPWFIPYLKNKPLVVTVHDMIHELFPEEFNKSDKTSEWKKLLCDRADAILCVSQNTAKDLKNIFGIDEHKIFITHLASTLHHLKPKEIHGFDQTKPFLLFVGNRSGYKNFNGAISALAEILKTDQIQLICIGNSGFTSDEIQLISNLGLNGLVIHLNATDAQLLWLYKNALALLFPSLYEGFGLPVAEALSAGCPVLLSNTGPLPEIAGKTGFYFDPTDPNSIRETVKNFLTHIGLESTLISEREKAKRRGTNFSWKATAESTLKGYQYALEKHKSNV